MLTEELAQPTAAQGIGAEFKLNAKEMLRFVEMGRPASRPGKLIVR